jgi:urease accessory protein
MFDGETDPLTLLRLLHLADSALPIGATPHSFGIETLVADGDVTAERVAVFLRDYLSETGLLDAVFCRAAHRLAQANTDPQFGLRWLDLNQQLSAIRMARESRAASQTLGRRLVELISAMHGIPLLEQALTISRADGSGVHHSTAFGLVGGALHVDENATVMAYLHQSVAGLISACQRLMPIGQRQASQMLWEIKPALIDAAATSQQITMDEVATFTPLLDVGSMRHPRLETRLFIS